MELRLGASAAVAAGIVATGAPGRHSPEVWQMLGYPFEAAGMIAALFACMCARLWSADQLRHRKTFRWSLDIPVSALTFAATICAVIALRPSPWAGLLYGAGLGVIGEGLFHYARKFADKSGLFERTEQ
ncbi:hypothetical protein [Pelagerythrobacter sp.]|uniref:hypothetical protein n=1 Tax=Pelagerythrobacter sp. TaxID=2800702 RepID=UPI0035AF2DC4